MGGAPVCHEPHPNRASKPNAFTEHMCLAITSNILDQVEWTRIPSYINDLKMIARNRQ